MNHYCTYFDRGFLIQGLALWRSLEARDRDAILWVLALDGFSADVLRGLGGSRLRVVRLEEIEASDAELLAAKATRSRVEYYFTLSPCWPRWLLANVSEIDRITYLDADVYFFGDPAEIFAAMDNRGAAVAITRHRFRPWQKHYERHGIFNVGFQAIRRGPVGESCLAEWRRQCLAWCYDRLEGDRYADQKYLDAWPAGLGAALLIVEHPGLNLAPWNWLGRELRVSDVNGAPGNQRILIDGQPLVMFHFARFRPTVGTRWWESGQLDYGVMPRRWRNAIYAPYVTALLAARAEIAAVRPGFDFPERPARLAERGFWRGLPGRLLFGGTWLRLGGQLFNLRAGLGRWSGQCLAAARTIFLRR